MLLGILKLVDFAPEECAYINYVWTQSCSLTTQQLRIARPYLVRITPWDLGASEQKLYTVLTRGNV